MVVINQVDFHLSLAMVITGIIDYGTSKGCKYFNHSIKKLNKELFDYEYDDLHLFIDTLQE